MREQNYLRDVLPMLLERARDAGQHARESRRDSSGDPFQQGLAQGYYEVLASMVNQLEAFGIPRASVGLPEKLDLEGELL